MNQRRNQNLGHFILKSKDKVCFETQITENSCNLFF